jgi:endonuclease III related protein
MLKDIYTWLLDNYGPQGWWPLVTYKGTNPTKTGALKGYHPGDYSFPHNDSERFEICIGAILTQNTTWLQVEKALVNLKRMNALNVKGMKKLSVGKLKEAIKCAGYYNQKSKYIKEFSTLFSNLEKFPPTRAELLSVNGIGEETADSMLLYAFGVPTFVIDAYTRRILLNLGLITADAKYEDIKALFENNIDNDLIIYQEFHALLVEHAKRYYNNKNVTKKCPLSTKFGKN